MEKHSLPEDLRSKASTAGGEQACRMADVEDIILAARNLAMACIGGQVQFRFPGGTCETYWVNFDSTERQPGETWPAYVWRSAEETLFAFRRICRETDFRELAREWDFGKEKIDQGLDPLDLPVVPDLLPNGANKRTERCRRALRSSAAQRQNR